MELREIVVSGLLIGIFIIAMLSFAVTFSIDNNSTNVLTQGEFNRTFTELIGNTTASTSITESQARAQEEDNPKQDVTDLPLGTTPKSGIAYRSMAKNYFDTTIRLISDVLGISPTVLKIITAMLLLTMVMLVWSFVKSGR